MILNRISFQALSFLLFVFLIAFIWIRFLSLIEAVLLLSLYVFAMISVSHFIVNEIIRSAFEYTVSILVDWYIGLKIVCYFRPNDRVSELMWTVFLLFGYLIGIKRLWRSKK